MAEEGMPVQVATRILGVSESGYYDFRRRGPSPRQVRHALLTDLIREVHAASRGTYGYRRVHAELTLGRGLVIAHGTVELLMARAGLAGVTGRPRWKGTRPDLIAKDLVERQFSRDGPNQLWVTDITEHHTREGKLYRAVGARHLLPLTWRLPGVSCAPARMSWTASSCARLLGIASSIRAV
jgi:transposase InsO family protein